MQEKKTLENELENYLSILEKESNSFKEKKNKISSLKNIIFNFNHNNNNNNNNIEEKNSKEFEVIENEIKNIREIYSDYSNLKFKESLITLKNQKQTNCFDKFIELLLIVIYLFIY